MSQSAGFEPLTQMAVRFVLSSITKNALKKMPMILCRYNDIIVIYHCHFDKQCPMNLEALLEKSLTNL